MSAERVTYLDSSAIVKLAVIEAESDALRRYLRQRRPLASSALALTEVGRALFPCGVDAVRRGGQILARLDLVRMSDRLLRIAAVLQPTELRSLDAIHLATAQQLGVDLARIVTYDERMSSGALSLGLAVIAPS